MSNHVLVVEDQVPIARLLRVWIEAEGCSVTIATGAEQALLMAAAQAPVVAMCDIRLPGGRDGFWLVEQLRLFRPHTAAVMTTGLPQFADEDGDNTGVADFVMKPFTRERIVAALRHGLADHRARVDRSPGGEDGPVDLAMVLRTIVHTQRGTSARHAEHVSPVALALAAALNCSGQEVADIECAVLLGEVERSDIYGIARTVPMLASPMAIVTASQEHWDGTGFPLGAKGNAIPMGARIVAVARAFDTLVAGVGIDGTTAAQAVETLCTTQAARFDPAVLAALRRAAAAELKMSAG